MLEGCKLLRICLRIREGHLMGVERALDVLPVELLGA